MTRIRQEDLRNKYQLKTNSDELRGSEGVEEREALVGKLAPDRITTDRPQTFRIRRLVRST